MRQQPLLARQAAAVTRQGAVRTDHAMTRQDDGDRIAAIGEPDRARSAGIAEISRQLAIAPSLAVRNLAQRRPDSLLKRRTMKLERQVKLATCGREIFAQLLRCYPQCARARITTSSDREIRFASSWRNVHVNADQRGLPRNQ